MNVSINFALAMYLFLPFFDSNDIQAQSEVLLKENFNKESVFEVKGKGICEIKDRKLISRVAYASYGKSDWTNYRFDSRENILLLTTGEQTLNVFPEYDNGYLHKSLAIANTDIPESDIFDGIKHMDSRSISS